MQKKIRILAIASDSWACGVLRIQQPYQQLANICNNDVNSPFWFEFFVPSPQQGVSLDRLDNYDCIIFQRILDENGLRLINHAKNRNKIVIQEMDDNIFHVSSNNPFFHATHKTPYRKIFRQGILFCDYVHTTVPEIADAYMKEIGLKREQYKVFPNAVFLQHPKLHPSQNRRKELPADKVIFGFQGGSSHKDDLSVLPPIYPILDEVPNSIFAFCSDIYSFQHKWNNIPLKYRNKMVFIQPVTDSFDNFPNLPSMFDLGLIPAEDTVFNQSKSHLKILEFSSFQIPTITSPVPDYQRFAQLSNNANIVVKKNKVKIWTEQTIHLLRDKEMRQDLGSRAWNTILEYFTLEKINSNRLDFFKEIFNV